jgi:vacuolar-type H+-ATPase subunit E/Vma4
MPIWEDVELFCRAIFDEGRQEAEKILTKAKAEAERTIAEARERAEKDFQKEIIAQKSGAHAEAKRLVDAAELKARKRIIEFREQTIHEILGALEQRLKDFLHQPSYSDFLLPAIKEGIDTLGGREFTVELGEEDLTSVKPNIRALEKERGLKIELRASPSMEGCLRIYTGDQRLLYDNSLFSRLQRSDDEIRREIWRKIFGAERSDG